MCEHCSHCDHSKANKVVEITEEKQSLLSPTLLRLAAAFVLMLGGIFLPIPEIFRIACFVIAYLLSGGGVVFSAIRNIVKGHVFDENFLMTLASAGAFAIGEMGEAVAVMVFYGIGEYLQDFAVARSNRNIATLMDLRSDIARVFRNNQYVEISPEEVEVGERLQVKPGEKIPLDGIVKNGSAWLDTRALTGESRPRRIVPEDEVFSGTISTDGVLEIEVTRTLAESTVTKILDLVRNAAEKKSPSEKFISRFARIYTPIVVLFGALIAVVPPLFGFGGFAEWIHKSLTFLIVSCPCALVLSVPVSFFGGIGGAARRGILVKGGNFLELLPKIGTIVFDKTGTLTQGVFRVAEQHPEPGIKPEELLRLAAIAESQSNHPIAKSVLAEFGGEPEVPISLLEHAGMGIEARSISGTIWAGNRKLMEKLGISGLQNPLGTVVHVALDRKYQGYLLLSDQIKPGVADALNELRREGIERFAMLTGDNTAIAEQIASELKIDLVCSELLPDGKVAELEKLMAEELPGKKTAFAGDGINDAPVLTRADLGIAMGGVGSDAAIEAADMVLMTDDISGIAKAMRVAKKTLLIVRENIVFSLGVKFAVMGLAVFGIASVWFAIFADVGVSVLAVLNALRSLGGKK